VTCRVRCADRRPCRSRGGRVYDQGRDTDGSRFVGILPIARTERRAGLLPFSPRLADLGGARFWRLDARADYGALNALAKHRITGARVVRQWEDILRVAGSLKLGAIRAVVNAVILWSTLYTAAALEQLRGEGYAVRSEDAARLSPLSTHHINVLGRYAFLLAEQVTRGGMRPLRGPEDDDWSLA
jgi:hypothetical protein